MGSTERLSGHARAARCVSILAIGLTIVAAACAPTSTAARPAVTSATSGTVPPGTATADDVLSIESNTQAHVGQLAIGAGNFWEEEYTPPGEVPRRGLTAGLWLTYRDDPAQNRQLRVHPGQEIVVPGHRLSILAIEPRVVRLAIRREP